MDDSKLLQESNLPQGNNYAGHHITLYMYISFNLSEIGCVIISYTS